MSKSLSVLHAGTPPYEMELKSFTCVRTREGDRLNQRKMCLSHENISFRYNS